MNSNLCIDIGNSRIKFAIFENDHLIHFARFDHNSEPEIAAWLAENNFNRVIYSSVIKTKPHWLSTLEHNKKITKLTTDLKLPFRIYYNPPESLGTDRIAAIAGAIAHYPKEHILVVNAGTCVTYDLIDDQHEYYGGNIAPGLDMRLRAMHEFTASLPRVTAADTGFKILGNSTNTALLHGGLHGIVLEIEGYYARLLPEYPHLKCILTGGSAPYLVNQLKIGIFAEPYLVLKGLNSILNYQ